mmetsp:Transcript_26645/g.39523  ORF Transcript_26645/g.39523 Transcript_26645/m.39523 type:complete len:330 (-) Transcript_26645:520-1509(-)|eukprot:CAMPEP_0116020806 /NCGR_PEP_ID=MMETSP0321-20121206/10015_1 /TAXON_ID=163516 /ORGANISM="Leptocylindrus danicus var. danicus, Strain B650" /LENGTH=329 /DNA_ID=CAMNT_0003491565 /DNA_START=1010 /DNA_END=1999 /DNA_ORIENTATION=-
MEPHGKTPVPPKTLPSETDGIASEVPSLSGGMSAIETKVEGSIAKVSGIISAKKRKHCEDINPEKIRSNYAMTAPGLLDSAKSAFGSSYEVFADYFKHLTTQKMDCEAKNLDLLKEINAKEIKLNQLENTFVAREKNYQHTVASLVKDLAEEKSWSEKIVNSADAYKSKLDEVETEMKEKDKKKNDRIKVLEEENMQLSKTGKTMRAQINLHEVVKAEMDRKISKKNEMIKAMDNDSKAMQAQIKVHEKIENEQKETVEQKDRENKELQNQVTTLLSSLKKMEEKINEHINNGKKRDEEIDILKEQNENLKVQNSKMKDWYKTGKGMLD